MSDAIFPKKWDSKLPDGFKDKAESFTNEELQRKIVEWSQAIDACEKDLENDSKLNALKEEVKSVTSIYKEPIQESQACIRYAVYLLKNRGKG